MSRAPLKVAVSQRVVVDPGTGERRDALDQRVAAWVAAAGGIALPVPNQPAGVAPFRAAAGFAAVLLTGGNDLTAYGGDAPERDATEAALLEAARRHQLPVFAICRGLQFLVHAAGGTLERRDGHVRTRHRLQVAGPVWGGEREVNSYHNYCVGQLPANAQVLATVDDGTVEAAWWPETGWLGVMWHPEREAAFDVEDLRWARRCWRLDA